MLKTISKMDSGPINFLKENFASILRNSCKAVKALLPSLIDNVLVQPLKQLLGIVFVFIFLAGLHSMADANLITNFQQEVERNLQIEREIVNESSSNDRKVATFFLKNSQRYSDIKLSPASCSVAAPVATATTTAKAGELLKLDASLKKTHLSKPRSMQTDGLPHPQPHTQPHPYQLPHLPHIPHPSTSPVTSADLRMPIKRFSSIDEQSRRPSSINSFVVAGPTKPDQESLHPKQNPLSSVINLYSPKQSGAGSSVGSSVYTMPNASATYSFYNDAARNGVEVSTVFQNKPTAGTSARARSQRAKEDFRLLEAALKTHFADRFSTDNLSRFSSYTFSIQSSDVLPSEESHLSQYIADMESSSDSESRPQFRRPQPDNASTIWSSK